MAENAKPRPVSAGSAGKKSQKGSPKRSASAGKSREANSAENRHTTKAGMPALPLGQRENKRNNFNAAKARADAAATSGTTSSRTSTHPSSRRQSGSSQISYSSKGSGRPGQRSRAKKKRGQDDPIQVFDENGKDVTPKPLSALKPTVLIDRLLSVSAQSVEGTEFEHSVPVYSRTGFSVTSTAGSLTPETVDLGTDLEESDGQESRRSRSYRGSAVLETPRHPKRKYAIVPAPIVQPKVPKVLYLRKDHM